MGVASNTNVVYWNAPLKLGVNHIYLKAIRILAEAYTRHMHSLSYRQIHTSGCYYKYSFFPASIVLWNKLPANLVLVPDLDSFKTGVSKFNKAVVGF